MLRRRIANDRVDPGATLLVLPGAAVLEIASPTVAVVGSDLAFLSSAAEVHACCHILRIDFLDIVVWKVCAAQLRALPTIDPQCPVVSAFRTVSVFEVSCVCGSATNEQ